MKHVAFLRGMNLGRRRITNEQLCAEFTAMGLGSAAAFLASGNVIFDAEDVTAADLATHIEAELERSLGWVVPTFVRRGVEVRAIAAREVFARELEHTAGRIQVAMLGAEPSEAARREVLDLATRDDYLELHGSELYWLPRGNLSDSQLDFKRMEAALGVMTIRTRRTLERIAAKFLAGE